MRIPSRLLLPILLVLLAVPLAVGPACKKAPPPKPLPPVAVPSKKEAPAETGTAQGEEKTVVFSYKVSERNPFGSLLRVKKVTEDGIPEEQLTPLQRVPVTDMRVESIIVSRRRSIAHVITPDGKAHIVTVGTPMGRHKGKIVRITSDEVIVEEQFEDYLGRGFKQETALRLREKEGENL
ncbi:MAG: pilus assembly protein PilP [bacterium]|nr:MAG: pilus assembly protein PilP [bacterium]